MPAAGAVALVVSAKPSVPSTSSRATRSRRSTAAAPSGTASLAALVRLVVAGREEQPGDDRDPGERRGGEDARGRRGGRSGGARRCGRRRSLLLLRARAGALAVAQQVVARLVGGLEPRRVGADPEAVPALPLLLLFGPGPAWKVRPPLPDSFGSGMSTPCPRMQRAYFSAASWSLARLAGSMVSPPPICMYFWQALCADFIFGSLKFTLPPGELDAAACRRAGGRACRCRARACTWRTSGRLRRPCPAGSRRWPARRRRLELPHAPSARAAPTAARRSGDLVMAGHEARPT